MVGLESVEGRWHRRVERGFGRGLEESSMMCCRVGGSQSGQGEDESKRCFLRAHNPGGVTAMTRRLPSLVLGVRGRVGTKRLDAPECEEGDSHQKFEVRFGCLGDKAGVQGGTACGGGPCCSRAKVSQPRNSYDAISGAAGRVQWPPKRLLSTRASTQKTHATAFYPSGYCRFRGSAASFGG